MSEDKRNDGTIMDRLEPSLIHRVLLTDAKDFASLSSYNNPRTRFTLSFTEFCEQLDGDVESMDRQVVLKKAVRDHIVNRAIYRGEEGDMNPLGDLLCELHQQTRALIPNRRDLHSILQDEKAREAQALDDFPPLILNAAKALSQLESESRATTTQDLIHLLQQSRIDENNAMRNVTVVLYLLYKAELCRDDMQDFYLVNVWAPQIHKEGPELERKLYQKQFGEFHDPSASPATRQWILDLVQAHLAANPQARHHDDRQYQRQEPTSLSDSIDARKALIRAGWIDDIVFRGVHNGESPFHLPEIFAQDHGALQTLREITRLAVAGCALALQACSIAGVDDSQQVLTNPDCVTKQQRAELVQALRNRSLPPDLYEEAVVKQMKQLTQEWSNKFGKNQEIDDKMWQQLKGRVIAVLQGQDPVMKLLDGRTKMAVRDVLVFPEMDSLTTKATVSEMKTGQSNNQQSNKQAAVEPSISSKAEKLFCQRGLAFFAPELAMVSKLAGKVVSLAIELYWDDLLDRLVLEASGNN